MTMTNAEWCIKNGYKFSDLRWDFMKEPGIGSFYLNDKNVGKVSSLSIYEALKTWLDAEHVEPILDDAERRYLSEAIRPFKDKAKYIQKFEGHWYARYFEQISIRYYDEIIRRSTYFNLPTFDEGTMYKGMEVNRHYTLEELGL